MSTRFYSSVEYSGQRSSNDADTIYYNASIINNSTADTIGNVVNPPVVFNEVRQQPILTTPNDYMASVIQLGSTGATKDLPLWIPLIQPSSVICSFVGSVIGNVLTVTRINSGAFLNGANLAFGSNGDSVTTTTIVGPISTSNGLGTYTLSASTTAGNQSMSLVSLQTDANLTVYSVTVDFSGTSIFQEYLIWTPENAYIPAPPSPVLSQNLSSEYYYAYTFRTFVKMFNTALAKAWTASNIMGDPPELYQADKFAGGKSIGLNPNSFVLYYPGGIPVPGVNIYINTPLEAMLSNFPGTFVNDTVGRTFLFDSPLSISSDAYLVQDYPSISNWSPVDALIVTSNLLPLVMEQYPAPGLVGSSSENKLGQLVPGSFLPVMSDSIINLITASDWRQFLYIEPKAEFKMISLTSSDTPIQNIDFQVWWRNRLDNQLYPLRLSTGASINIKVMFRRKQMGV